MISCMSYFASPAKRRMVSGRRLAWQCAYRKKSAHIDDGRKLLMMYPPWKTNCGNVHSGWLCLLQIWMGWLNYVLSRVILSLDRHISSYAGRPCALQDEEFVPSTICLFTRVKILVVLISTCHSSATMNIGNTDSSNQKTSRRLFHSSTAICDWSIFWHTLCA